MMRIMFGILILLMGSPAASICQTLSGNASLGSYPHPFEFELMDSAVGTAEQLFTRASEWLILKYKPETDPLKLSDKSGGKIIAKGYYQGPQIHLKKVAVPSIVSYTLIFTLKDNRYRLHLQDFQTISIDAGGAVNLSEDIGDSKQLMLAHGIKSSVSKQTLSELMAVKNQTFHYVDTLFLAAKTAMHAKPDDF